MGTTQTMLLKVCIATIFHKKTKKVLTKYRKIEAKTVTKIEKYGFIKQGQLIVCNSLT